MLEDNCRKNSESSLAVSEVKIYTLLLGRFLPYEHQRQNMKGDLSRRSWLPYGKVNKKKSPSNPHILLG
jgi:hypothetical protein